MSIVAQKRTNIGPKSIQNHRKTTKNRCQSIGNPALRVLGTPRGGLGAFLPPGVGKKAKKNEKVAMVSHHV